MDYKKKVKEKTIQTSLKKRLEFSRRFYYIIS